MRILLSEPADIPISGEEGATLAISGKMYNNPEEIRMSQVTQNLDRARVRQEWQHKLSALADQIAGWSASRGWAVERFDNSIDEEGLGAYTAPTLHIHTGAGALVVEP